MCCLRSPESSSAAQRQSLDGRWLLCCVATLMIASCTKLDTSAADRCVTHPDCRSGRACQDGRCVPLDSLFDAGLGDAAAPAGMSSAGNGGSRAGSGGAAGRSTEPRSGAGSGGMDGSTNAGASGAGSGGAPQEAGSGGAPEPEPESDAGHDPDDDAGTPDPDGEVIDHCSTPALAAGEVVLWLDAAQGIVADADGRVQSWADRSEYQHIAMATGEPVDWPLYVPEAAAGHPAVQFGMVDAGPTVRRLVVLDDPSLWFGTGEFAIIVVIRHRTSTDAELFDMRYASVYQKVCAECAGFPGVMLFANDFWDTIQSGGAVESSFLFQIAARGDYAARPSSAGFNDNRVHLVVARRSRDELGVEVDDLPHATALVTSTLDLSIPNAPVAIGAHMTADVQVLEGEIFELVAIRGTTAVSHMADCFMTKYGLR